MLKTRLLQTSLILLLFAVVASATAGIYRWVDEDGHVQYGDRPPPDVGESQEMDVRVQESSPPGNAPVDRQQARERLLQQYQTEREEKKEAAAKKRLEKKKADTRCAYAKRTLSEYLEHGRLYERLPNQERKYLTDQERDAEIAKARAEVKMWCK